MGTRKMDRREFLRLAALGSAGLAATSRFPGLAPTRAFGAPLIQAKPYAGQTVSVTINAAGEKGPITGPYYEHRAEFEDLTGAKLNIIEVPFEDHYTKVKTDLETNTGAYDGFVAGAWWLGDLVSADFIVPYDDYYKDPKFPQWDIEQVLPGPRALLTWAGKKYMVCNDHDGQVMYYRKDALTNKDNQAKFKEKYKYDLPVPPTTMDQFRDVAEFFTGWDWNGDGQPDHGVTMHLKVGGQGMFHFMSFSAPYLISPTQKLYWFDPKDMKPLVTSEGHQAALEALIGLVKFGPSAMLGWSLGESWDYFCKGKAALTFTWGDLGGLVQDTKTSVVQGKMGCAPIPGTNKWYDLTKKAWVDSKAPNIVGNTTGGSWSPVISKLSKAKEAAYYLFALQAQKKYQMIYATRGWDGVDPGAFYQFLPPNGTATLQEYTAQGWEPGDVTEYTNAYFANFNAPLQFPYLRIPGTYEYWVALDRELSDAATGQKKVADALAACSKAWDDITDRLGREDQLKYYKDSMGL
jgi:multiple sugar transport system substrate-binding protein